MSPSPSRGYAHLPSEADLFYLSTTLSTSDEALNLHVAPPSKSSLSVGVLLLGQADIQLLDIAAIDVLVILRIESMRRMDAPDYVRDDAVKLDIHYVSEAGESTFPLTSGAQLPVTNSLENAPQFDILIIPGSFSCEVLSTAAYNFLNAQAKSPTLLALMSVSSGILFTAQSDVLTNRRASAPNPLMSTLQNRYAQTVWQDSRLARQGNVWSSGSGLCGVDMMAAWMRQYFWDRNEAVEWALEVAGVPYQDEDE